jgi:hypothetical protein
VEFGKRLIFELVKGFLVGQSLEILSFFVFLFELLFSFLRNFFDLLGELVFAFLFL